MKSSGTDSESPQIKMVWTPVQLLIREEVHQYLISATIRNSGHIWGIVRISCFSVNMDCFFLLFFCFCVFSCKKISLDHGKPPPFGRVTQSHFRATITDMPLRRGYSEISLFLCSIGSLLKNGLAHKSNHNSERFPHLNSRHHHLTSQLRSAVSNLMFSIQIGILLSQMGPVQVVTIERR